MKRQSIIAFIIGTRPEIIKMAPIIRHCENEGIKIILIHTGQHYTYEMDKIFFTDLQISEPKYNLEVGSGSQGKQTGQLLLRIEEVLKKEKPSIVLVEGDTNSVLAGGISAVKLGIAVGHVEAGLRSYDRQMPEEINRILVDHISHMLFAPTKNAEVILLTEGINKNKIFITGNPIVDAVYQHLPLAMERGENILNQLQLEPNGFILVTIHRQENVDNTEKLQNILSGLALLHQELHLPIIYPIHPRTKKRISQFGLKIPSEIILTKPMGYLEFLFLLKSTRLVLTDSGGIQEEACILKVPCVTLRENTERPETLTIKSNILAGTNPESILESTKKIMQINTTWVNPFGDGKTAKRIIDIIFKELEI